MPQRRVTARNLPTKEAAPPLTGEPPIRYGRDTGVIGVELEQGGEWAALFAHATSTGASHSYINQSVTTGASPAFVDLTITTPVSIYALSHDAFADFDAAEHFLQTAIDHVSTGFATGLLKVTTGTGALSSITDNSANWDLAVAHISADGSSHTYIDQAVTTASSPTFAGADLGSGILVFGASDEVKMQYTSHASAATLNEYPVGGDIVNTRYALRCAEAVTNYCRFVAATGTTGALTSSNQIGGLFFTITQADPGTLKSKCEVTVNTGDSLQTALTIADTKAATFASSVDAVAGYKDNGTAGIDTTFLDADGNTITVSGGIITAKTAP